MKNWSKHFLAAFAAAGIQLFALDSQTAVSSAKEAVLLCGQAIIPSLFPMFFLCILLNGNIYANGVRPLAALGKLFGLHSTSGSLLLTCFLGGYPAGAQSLAQIYQKGHIRKNQAARLMACCNQAGPSFIFGILGSQFQSRIAPWALWIVQILSTLLLWMILGRSESWDSSASQESRISPAEALSSAITAVVRVCGWVILFRCVIGYFNKLFLARVDVKIRILITGLLELTNGCLLLSHIDSESTRFILCSVLLTFGGTCITFQTQSVIGDLSIKPYIAGKVLQTLISFMIAAAMSALLYRRAATLSLWLPSLIGLIIIGIYVAIEKKTVAFHGKKVYNNARKV